MTTAIVSEVTPETAGKIKKRQRTRVRVVRVEKTAAQVWGWDACIIGQHFDARDVERLEMWRDLHAESANSVDPDWPGYDFPPAYRNVYAALVEYATAAIDLLTADTGAEPTGTYHCTQCGQPGAARPGSRNPKCCPLRLGWRP